MCKLTVLVAVLVYCSACVAQDIQVDWTTVRPIHEQNTFFEDYPYLQGLKNTFGPSISELNIQEGHNTSRNEHPFQVGLVVNREDGNAFCGGSLISGQFVLTAGHCLFGAFSGIAVLGSHQIRDANEVGQRRIPTDQFIVHPGWNGIRLTDDIGLARLSTIVVFNDNIRPIRLPNYRQVPSSFSNQMGITSGWGRALFNSNLLQQQPSLLTRNSAVISSTLCRLVYPNIIETSQICVGFDSAEGLGCPLESGGPVAIIEADGQFTQLAVVSFVSGLGCSANRPAVLTRLPFYLRWIEENANIIIAEDYVF